MRFLLGFGLLCLAALPRPPGAGATSADLHTACTDELARFKAPKEFIVVDKVRRLGNGKADYRWAKGRAAQRDALAGQP